MGTFSLCYLHLRLFLFITENYLPSYILVLYANISIPIILWKTYIAFIQDTPLENVEIYANGISNEHIEQIDEEKEKEKQIAKNTIDEFIKNEQNSKEKPLEKNLERKKRDISGDRTVKVNSIILLKLYSCICSFIAIYCIIYY